MKKFLRTNAFYYAESKQLPDDIDITDWVGSSEMFSEKNILHTLPVETTFEKSISDLNKRIDDLTKLVNEPKKEIVKDDKPASVTSKIVSKKDTEKKK